jgi:hypothetical protein
MKLRRIGSSVYVLGQRIPGSFCFPAICVGVAEERFAANRRQSWATMLARGKSNRDILAANNVPSSRGLDRAQSQPSLARPVSTPQHPNQDGQHFFAGLVIHLVRRGIGGVQFNVLCERIKDKGTRGPAR